VADAKKTRPVEWLTFIVVLAGIPIAGLACYYTKVQADVAAGKLTDEANHRFETIEKEMNGTKERVVKLETLTKLANDVAALQARVSELQTKATTPTENTSLAAFSGHLAEQQQRWSALLRDHPLDSSQVQSLPQPAVTLPPNLGWLPPEDKKGLDSLLGKAGQNWTPPTFTPLPNLKLPAPPQEKPFPENIWDTVKQYPIVAFWLVVLLFSALANTRKK
jgi:hypothetical protein